MKLKQIWTFIRTVLWPFAKPFICASKEEAEELVTGWLGSSATKRGIQKEAPMPNFVRRCIEALEKEDQ